VVHALRNIHAVLEARGLLVDTQPVSRRPAVLVEDRTIGTLDMRPWLETIAAVDALFAQSVARELFEQEHEQRFLVTDAFDDGSECVETVSAWQGTHVPEELARRLESATSQVRVHQVVRLRLMRRRA
jgi:hypothetical protein